MNGNRWTYQEVQILKRNAHHSCDYIKKRLQIFGFLRTLSAIKTKRERLRLLHNLEGLSANQLAKFLGKDTHSITDAINKGYLKASIRKTGKKTFYITNQAIKNFVKHYPTCINLKKVDKYWFIDILVN